MDEMKQGVDLLLSLSVHSFQEILDFSSVAFLDERCLECPQSLGLQLANGSSRCEGRVEVDHANASGTVCDDSCSIEDAHMVCRQLGCGLTVSALPGASFSPGPGSILLDDVNCPGKQSSLG